MRPTLPDRIRPPARRRGSRETVCRRDRRGKRGCGQKRPDAARTAAATGRSNPAPSFLISAGARFTVTLLGGSRMPLFFNAVRTRSCASLTCAEGNPTILKQGSPSLTSASTCTGYTSIPEMAADNTLANNLIPFCRPAFPLCRQSVLILVQLMLSNCHINLY